MKNKTDISKLFLALVGVIYVFISLIAGILTGADQGFWIGFGFMTFSTAVAVGILLAFGSKGTTIRDVFFNAPIYYIGTAYFAVSVVVSLVFMVLDILPFKYMMVIELLLFGLFAVSFILAYINRTNADNVIEKVTVKNVFIKDASSKVEAIADACEDRELRTAITRLGEDIKYGKPAAGGEIAEIEAKISQRLAVLEYQVESKEFDKAKEALSEIKSLVSKRNQAAK